MAELSVRFARFAGGSAIVVVQTGSRRDWFERSEAPIFGIMQRSGRTFCRDLLAPSKQAAGVVSSPFRFLSETSTPALTSSDVRCANLFHIHNYDFRLYRELNSN